MLRHRAYKYRIFPTDAQKQLISKTIGCCRFVYNYFLHQWTDAYQTTNKGLSYYACSAQLPVLKKDSETAWLKEVDSIAVQASVRFLADSFDRFFKQQNAYPRFKSKKNPVQSYTTKFVNGNISIEENKIKLPKLGFVRFSKSRELNGRIINATVRVHSSGKYFVSLLCEEEIISWKPTNKSIGMDLGIQDFVILSDGQRCNNQRFTNKMAKKLAKEQRKLAKKKNVALFQQRPLAACKNYQKQKIKVARLYEQVANQRADFLHKLSTNLVQNHDILCIEDLHVKGMLRNRTLSKAISDVSWSEFVAMLRYKCEWYGKQLIQIGRWYPSSQICSFCGHPNGKKALSIREWACVKCNQIHDRDVNAARNIETEGLRIFKKTAGGTTVVA